MIIYLAGIYSRPNIFRKGMTDLYSRADHRLDPDKWLEKMKIYLAGGCTGNNNPIWRENRESPDKMESVFDLAEKIYILESFIYIKDWMNIYIDKYWNFMLDSGAFTFLQNNAMKGGVKWDDYVKRYAEFINANNIDLFFELDIDAIAEIKEVERLRALLERLTEKQSIPVWHIRRGKAYWERMIRDYDYVAIGGIVSGEIKRPQFPGFTGLLNMAKDAGTRVHGLGFTNLRGLEKYKFHSVDSTAWLYGNRAGYLNRFNGRTMEKFEIPPGNRLRAKEAAIFNFNEWIKFQRWAENNL